MPCLWALASSEKDSPYRPEGHPWLCCSCCLGSTGTCPRWVLQPGRAVSAVWGFPTVLVCILGWLWGKKIYISAICNAKAVLLM